MNLRLPSKSAFGAWLMSLPIALALPAAASLLLVGFSPLDLMLTGITVILHLNAYAVTGIPIFGRWYPFPDAPIWKFRYAILCGVGLGVPGIHLAMVLWRLKLGHSLSGLPDAGLALVGAGYGVCTAVAAWLARPVRGGVNEAAAGANPPL